MPGSTARVTQRSPFTFVSIIRSQSSGSADCTGSSPAARPALLTTTSSEVRRSRWPRRAASTAARSRTSKTSGVTGTPCFAESSRAIERRRSSRRPVTTTRAPSAAKRRAIASPKPLVAPVTSARRPFSGVISSSVSMRRPGYHGSVWRRPGRSTRLARAAHGRGEGGRLHDILVIGGGIHGAAVARDASHRGLDVLLVEKGDLASATSSRTSKLIHGGLRYLETGQLRLVSEALRERAILMRTAPEFVRPLPFLMPHLAGRGRPRRWVELGLWLYRFLAGSAAAAAPGASERRAVGAEEALRLAPGLDREGLRGAALFADAQMDDAPLCVAIALDAEGAGAAIRTHTEVVALARTVDGRAWRAHFRDRIAGVDGEAEARVIVNTAGPWVDEVRGPAFGDPAPSVRRTRGTHIVLPVVASGCALLLTARRDGRVYFIVPWGSHTLVGTTDDDDPADPAAAEPRPEDVRYLLEESVGALPGSFTGARPVRAFAGFRPLPRGHADRACGWTRERYARPRSRAPCGRPRCWDGRSGPAPRRWSGSTRFSTGRTARSRRRWIPRPQPRPASEGGHEENPGDRPGHHGDHCLAPGRARPHPRARLR